MLLFYWIAIVTITANNVEDLEWKCAEMKKLLDPSEVGGTPFLGISKPVIKAHGSSDARAIRNAILRAEEYAASGFIADVEENIELMKVGTNRQNLPDAP